MASIAWAVQNGDIDAVNQLVNKDNVNERFSNGRAAIHVASDYGHSAVLQFLVDLGADVQGKDEFGITPLLAAVWEGHIECVKILLKAGASRNVVAPDGTELIDCTEEEEVRKLLQN